MLTTRARAQVTLFRCGELTAETLVRPEHAARFVRIREAPALLALLQTAPAAHEKPPLAALLDAAEEFLLDSDSDTFRQHPPPPPPLPPPQYAPAADRAEWCASRRSHSGGARLVPRLPRRRNAVLSAPARGLAGRRSRRSARSCRARARGCGRTLRCSSAIKRTRWRSSPQSGLCCKRTTIDGETDEGRRIGALYATHARRHPRLSSTRARGHSFGRAAQVGPPPPGSRVPALRDASAFRARASPARAARLRHETRLMPARA